MKPILNLFIIAAFVFLWGCYDTTHSPMYVDNPKISIADITASYNRATIVFAPLNAGTISYAFTGADEPMPEAGSFTTVPASENIIVLPNLDSQTDYRIYAYSTSTIYEGETSPVTSNYFSTSELVDLNPGGKTANCYIVPTEGVCYKFDASVKGNTDTPVGDVAGVHVVWSDVANMIGDIELLEDGHVTFVAKQNVGNCVLAVTDAQDRILWSWHLWGTGGIPDDEVFVNAAGTSYNVMDRNLGAFSATSGSTCVVFQWGRKDPFSNGHFVYVGNKTTTDRHITYWPPVKWNETGDQTNNNIRFTTENPASFIDNAGQATGDWTWEIDYSLWGDASGFAAGYSAGGWSGEKSMYDPCPEGYRVGNVNTFSGLSFANSLIGAWNNGYWVRRTAADATGSWFPVTASRDPSHGGVVRGNQCELWYGNPSGSTSTARPRIFTLHATAMGVAGTAVASYAHGVRCVKHNPLDSKLN